MEILESILLAWESMKANKLRSLLTMLGIIIGVSSVITVVAIGQGGRAAIDSEMESFGANRFGIYYTSRRTVPVFRRSGEHDVVYAHLDVFFSL